MAKILGDFNYVLVRLNYKESATYRTVEELLLDLLTSNGYEFFEKFKQEILTEAQTMWDADQLDNYQDEEE